MGDTGSKGKGGAVELPFSIEVLALYRRVEQATSKKERIQHMLEFAAVFANQEHDPSDASATDSYHMYFEEYAKAKLEFEQKALRIGRLAADCITQYLASHPGTTEEVDDVLASAQLPDSQNN